jgi:hypothetical protein
MPLTTFCLAEGLFETPYAYGSWLDPLKANSANQRGSRVYDVCYTVLHHRGSFRFLELVLNGYVSVVRTLQM